MSSDARLSECLGRIASQNNDVKAIITITETEARAALRNADSYGPLSGRIVSVKDNIDTANTRTTAGSKLFEDRVPNSDATVVRRLKRAGAAIVGKENMHELAFGATTQNEAFGFCRNAWDYDRLPGGSSGGGAVAVALGFSEIAIGSDTGGSVRVPAALNGVTGLRPTFGRTPLAGTIMVSPNFDTLGPIARAAIDVAKAYEVIAGYDPFDATTADVPVESWSAHYANGFKALTIGVLQHVIDDEATPEVGQCMAQAISVFKELGAAIKTQRLPRFGDMPTQVMTCLQADAAAEHSVNLARHPELFGSDVAERLRLGASRSAVDYSCGWSAIRLWRREVLEQLEDCDVLVLPTVGFIAPMREATVDSIAATHKLTRLTSPWSGAGVPALSIPCGFVENLPVGIQMIGAHWSEARLLAAAITFQEVTDFHARRPRTAR